VLLLVVSQHLHQLLHQLPRHQLLQLQLHQRSVMS
jgi:hypothetical protein